MDAVARLRAWVVGQGRVMILAGVSFSISALIINSENILWRGILIPVALLMAMSLGYDPLVASSTERERRTVKYTRRPLTYANISFARSA